MISILIPVYNVKNFVGRCLESVAAQTYQGPMECIIVDDCGNDGSIEIAKKFISEYKGRVVFRILHHAYNRGLAAARNTAVEAAVGEFIMHVDSDDWLEPTAVEHLLLKQQEMNADIVSGNALRHGEHSNSVLKEREYKTPMDMVYKMMEITYDHVIWRRMIRRSLYIDHGIRAVEGINVGEDHHTMPRLAYYAKKIAFVDEIVYHYNCLNPNSYMTTCSSGFNLKRFRSNLASIEIIRAFFLDKDEYCVAKIEEIKKDYLNSCMWNAAVLNDITAYNEIKTAADGAVHGFWYWKMAMLINKKNILKQIVKKVWYRIKYES